MTIQISRTRLQIIQSVLRALGGIVGTATGGGNNTSLIDTFGLQGGDDEHNGKFVYMSKVAGVTATDKTWVTDYDGTNQDATVAPAVSGSIANGDIYEMYPRPFIRDDIIDAVDRAFVDLARKGLQVKQTSSQWTEINVLEYAWLSSFASIHKVEYVRNVGIDRLVSDAETAWTAGSANVTVTKDTSFKRFGSASAKLVEDGNSGAGDILGYDTITSLDISDCDRLEFDMYSSVDLTAGQIDIALDNTAAIASPIEEIDVPAMDAATWYRHSVALANPQTDTAIISVGLIQTSDVGAATYYIDNIRAVKNGSKEYLPLNGMHWELSVDSTNYLKLTQSGLTVVQTPTQIRLSGLQLPTIMTADSDTSEIDPEFVFHFVMADILLNNTKSRQLDVENRKEAGEKHLALALDIKKRISVNFPDGSRFIT